MFDNAQTNVSHASIVTSDNCQIALSGDTLMLETIAIILLILWALGLVTSYSMGGFIHILLVVAIVVVLIRVIQGRRL